MNPAATWAGLGWAGLGDGGRGNCGGLIHSSSSLTIRIGRSSGSRGFVHMAMGAADRIQKKLTVITSVDAAMQCMINYSAHSASDMRRGKHGNVPHLLTAACRVAAAATQFTNQPRQTGRQDTYYLPHCHHQTGGKTRITYHTAHVMLPHITHTFK